jgi:hypothetical protein
LASRPQQSGIQATHEACCQTQNKTVSEIVDVACLTYSL